MRLNKLFLLLALIALVATLPLMFACGDDDDDDDDDDTTDDDTADDDDDDDITWSGDESVVVDTPDGAVEVELNGLPAFMWTDPEDDTEKMAVLVSTVVDEAFAKDFDPADYKYTFIASDGYNLYNKLDGDYRVLPFYEDLELGWFIQYEEEEEKFQDIRVIWDDSLGFENFMSARLMNGGTIGMIENVLFDEDVYIDVEYMDKGAKTTVNLNGMPAFYDADQDSMAVYIHLIVLDGELEEFDPKNKFYEFNFIGSDDWSLMDELDPGEPLPIWEDDENSQDIHHGWIAYDGEENGWRAFWDDETGFSGMYKVKMMDGGTIQANEYTPE